MISKRTLIPVIALLMRYSFRVPFVQECVASASPQATHLVILSEMPFSPREVCPSEPSSLAHFHRAERLGERRHFVRWLTLVLQLGQPDYADEAVSVTGIFAPAGLSSIEISRWACRTLLARLRRRCVLISPHRTGPPPHAANARVMRSTRRVAEGRVDLPDGFLPAQRNSRV